MTILPVKKLLVFTLLTALIPAYLLMLLGFYCWFRFIVFLSKRLKNLEYPVTGVSTFLTPDKIHSRPNSTLVHLAVLKGIPDIKVIMRDLQILYSNADPEGRRKYDKLGLTIVKWMGYVFWKKAKSFRIQDHVHAIYDQKINHESISTFVEDIIRKPFKKGEPLWEIFVLYNVPKGTPPGVGRRDGKTFTYVVFRTHHLLLDGMTLLKLWYKADGSSKVPSDLIKYSTCSGDIIEDLPFWSKVMKIFQIVLATPYLHSRILCTPNDINCLTVGYTNYNGEWFCSGINKIQIDKYRQPLRDLQFSLTHVLLAAYTRGLRKFLEMNYDYDKVPESVHILGSIPLSNHPNETLTNHWTIMRYKAGIREDSLFLELQRAKNGYTQAVKSLIPDAFATMSEVGRWLPGKLYEVGLETRKSGTLAISNIPGPTNQQKMFGLPVTDRMIWLPLTRNNAGIALLFLTYNGSGTIALTADSGCVKNRVQFNQLNNLIVQEFRYILDEVIRTFDDTSRSCDVSAEELKEIKIL